MSGVFFILQVDILKPASNLLLNYEEWCKAKAKLSKLKSDANACRQSFYTVQLLAGILAGMFWACSISNNYYCCKQW